MSEGLLNKVLKILSFHCGCRSFEHGTILSHLSLIHYHGPRLSMEHCSWPLNTVHCKLAFDRTWCNIPWPLIGHGALYLGLWLNMAHWPLSEHCTWSLIEHITLCPGLYLNMVNCTLAYDWTWYAVPWSFIEHATLPSGLWFNMVPVHCVLAIEHGTLYCNLWLKHVTLYCGLCLNMVHWPWDTVPRSLTWYNTMNLNMIQYHGLEHGWQCSGL
jgi:hypothetical protein